MATWREDMQDELNSIQKQLERFIGDSGSFSLFRRGSGRNFREPLTNFHETDKEFIVTVDIPGVNKDDIEILPTEGGITIKAEKNAEIEEEEDDTRYRERRYMGFYHYIALPDEADRDDIDATYRRGMLRLRIPKRKPLLKRRRTITVEED